MPCLCSKVYVSRVNGLQASLVACGTEGHGVRLCDLRCGDTSLCLRAPVSGGASVRALDWSPSGAGHLLVAGRLTSDGKYLSARVCGLDWVLLQGVLMEVCVSGTSDRALLTARMSSHLTHSRKTTHRNLLLPRMMSEIKSWTGEGLAQQWHTVKLLWR